MDHTIREEQEGGDKLKLKDKVVLITGGASGMGKASCILFAREGAKVVVADINEQGAKAVSEMVQSEGGKAVAIKTDVSIVSDIKSMIDTAIKNFGRLDILLNVAGIPCTSAVEGVTEQKWIRTFDVNAKAFFFVCQHAFPIMKKQGGGVMLVVSSVAPIRPRPLFSVYSASKAAVTNLARSFALEFAPFNIRVNSINPVATETPMLKDFMRPGIDLEEGRKAFINTIPLGRLGMSEDVANTAAWLASDEASFLTGLCIPVDGGRSI